MFSSLSDKAKLLGENFSKNSSLNDSGISLVHFRTNLKLLNIPKLAKKAIIGLVL